MCSCTRTCYIPIESVRTEYRDHTERERDSVFIHDSITVQQRGDTVFLDRWHTQYRDRVVHDSIFSHNTDSIQVPYPVERQLSRWEMVKMDFGGVAIGVTGAVSIAIVVWLIKLIRRKL